MMRHPRALAVLSLASSLLSVNSQAVVSIGQNGTPCLAVPTVSVQPYYYSSYFAGPTTIYNFNGNGDNITINNGPTTFITNGFITVTATVTVSSGGSGAGISPTYTAVPPPTTTAPAPTYTITTTNAAGAVITTTVVQPAFRIGQGLPSGTATSIPSETPIILGFAYSDPKTPATQVDAILFEQRSGAAGTSGRSCADATRFYLHNSQLIGVGTNDVVGRNSTDFYGMISPWQYPNDVSVRFSIVDGVLAWNTADRGAASFYVCASGSLYAGFPNPPFSGCSSVTVGGVSAAACPIDNTGSSGSSSSPTMSSTSSVAGGSTTASPTSSGSSGTNTSNTPSTTKPASTPTVSSSGSTSGSGSTSSSGMSTRSTSASTSSSGLSSSSGSSSGSSSTASTASTASPSSSTTIATTSVALSPSASSAASQTTSPTSNITPTTPGGSQASSTTLTTTSSTTTTTSPATTSAIQYCPQYNFTTAPAGDQTYEIYCDMKLVGKDLQPFYPPGYTADDITDFNSCVNICNVWNVQNSTGTCVGVTYVGPKACYPYAYFQQNPPYTYAPGNNAARLIYSAYPQITDAPSSSTTTSGSTTTVTPTSTTTSSGNAAGSSSTTSSPGSSGSSSSSTMTTTTSTGPTTSTTSTAPTVITTTTTSTTTTTTASTTTTSASTTTTTPTTIIISPTLITTTTTTLPTTTSVSTTTTPSTSSTVSIVITTTTTAAAITTTTTTTTTTTLPLITTVPTVTTVATTTTTTTAAAVTTTTVTTTAAAGPPDPSGCNTAVTTNSATATAPVTSDAWCPTYDLQIVEDTSNGKSYGYEIYCDAEIGGSDVAIPAAIRPSINSFNTCLDACNYINAQNTTCVQCEAIIYWPGNCYPKNNIYIQQALGQYNYKFAGRTAAQIMESPKYPRPTATKVN